jgi:NADH-quinone oxidoreductase subunit A
VIPIVVARALLSLSMPSSLSETYLPILLQVILGVGVAIALVTLGAVLGQKVRNKVKDTPYECGVNPTGNAQERFSVKFYLVAMLFILFDIEAIFLYPWAVVFRELKMFAFVEMLIFIVVVLVGFYYIWKKGVLAWTQPPAKTPAAPVSASTPYSLVERS